MLSKPLSFLGSRRFHCRRSASMVAGPDDGNASSGAKIFKAKCATCHTCNEGGPNKQGPNLFAVMGRQSGSVSGFKCECILHLTLLKQLH